MCVWNGVYLIFACVANKQHLIRTVLFAAKREGFENIQAFCLT